MLIAIILSLSLLPITSHAKELVIIDLNTTTEEFKLRRSEGYALFMLNTEGVAPSIELAKIKSYSLKKNRNTRELSFTETKYTVNFKGKKKGLYLAILPAGNYQITKVNAPFYNLPYKLATDNRTTWRFSITKHHVNYIGEVVISKDRGTNFVDAKLLNRIAKNYDEINALTQGINFPLSMGTWHKDTFLSSIKDEDKNND